jgi:flavin-dependent dehydrogenase
MSSVADVVVVGGGPAGAAAAITAARAGLVVVLLERRQEPSWKIGETLAPQAIAMLSRLGVEAACDHLDSPGNCSAWGSRRLAATDFISNPYGCGWQIDRAAFERMLQDEAQAAGVEVRRGVEMVNCSLHDETWDLMLSDGRIKGHWIVDATGRAASVARQMGIGRLTFDSLISIYLVQHPVRGQDREARTLIESVQDGWWYTALTPGDRRTTSFLTDADLLKKQDWRNPRWFIDKLAKTKHVSVVLERHGYVGSDRPEATSARSGRLAANQGRQWLAVGDAAQAYDPLSGQGLFKALFTGHAGARTICDHLNGSSIALQEYERLLDVSWENFAATRKALYSLEQRWPLETFWHRRQSP